jgi:hypothetical protein
MLCTPPLQFLFAQLRAEGFGFGNDPGVAAFRAGESIMAGPCAAAT